MERNWKTIAQYLWEDLSVQYRDRHEGLESQTYDDDDDVDEFYENYDN
jgi:hypothetical protein